MKIFYLFIYSSIFFFIFINCSNEISNNDNSTKSSNIISSTTSITIPKEWETLLDISTLPLLQNNTSSEASVAWNWANLVTGGEVWIIDSKQNAQDIDEFEIDPSLLSLPITESGWPKSLPDGYSVSISSYYSKKTDVTNDNLRSTTFENVTGIYIITWKGKTIPDNNGNQQIYIRDTINDSNPELGTQFLNAGDHRVIAKVRNKDRGINIQYFKPDPSDPIRDVKIWAPLDFGAGLNVDITKYNEQTLGPGKLYLYNTEPAPGSSEPIWHPKYIEHLNSDPSGVIRCMSFLNINGITDETEISWEDRMPSNYTLTKLVGVDPKNYIRHPIKTFKGRCFIPYEWLINLANLTNKDLWIQTLHTATKDHIEGLAKLIATQLKSNLRVWYEYSNELWNNYGPYLPQYNKALNEGAKFGKSQGWGSGYLQGMALNTFEKSWQSSGGSDERLINVVSGFAISSTYNEQVLEGVKAVNPSLCEVLAITTYFGANLTSELYQLPYGNGSPKNEVYEQAKKIIRAGIYRDMEAWRSNGVLCHNNKIGMIAYEGGSHLLATGYGDWNNPNHAAFMNFLANLNKHQVMKDIYLEHWALWSALGGRTASLFVDIGSYSFFGYWGAKEDITESPDEAPKWAAYLEYADIQKNIRSMENPIGKRPKIQEVRDFRTEVNKSYENKILATDGDGVINLSIIGGKIPNGLTVELNNGISNATLTLKGSPKEIETAKFVLRASDKDGDPDYGIFTIIVDPEGATSNRLFLFDPTNIPKADLSKSENNENYRTRFDIVRSSVSDMTGSIKRFYLPYDSDVAFFNSHYIDSNIKISNTSPLNPSGSWALIFLVDEFNENNKTTNNGSPVVWDPAYNSSLIFYGLRENGLCGWVGSSLDLSTDRRYGVPTIFEGITIWRKEQMDIEPTNIISFGNGSNSASLILETDGIGADRVEIRFIIRNKSNNANYSYYISEAFRDKTSQGRFELIDFNNKSEIGKRWAIVNPTSNNFSIPDSSNLTFEPVDFNDVDKIGYIYKFYKSGWHYGFKFTRFLVIGMKNFL